MKYLHYFEMNVSHLYMKVGYCILTQTDVVQSGNHNVIMMSESEAREIAKANGYKFLNCRIDQQPDLLSKRVAEQKSRGKQPSKKCLDDARKSCGVKPYNTMTNYCWGDGYFSMACINKYGEELWDLACKMVRGGGGDE